MDVLEEVQRQRARPVEEQHIAFLEVVEITPRQVAQQGRQRVHALGAQQPVGMQQRVDLGDGLLQLLGRIAQQQRECLEGFHAMNSCGLRNFLPENSLAPLWPDEQPLPSVKLQPPFRS